MFFGLVVVFKTIGFEIINIIPLKYMIGVGSI